MFDFDAEPETKARYLKKRVLLMEFLELNNDTGNPREGAEWISLLMSTATLLIAISATQEEIDSLKETFSRCLDHAFKNLKNNEGPDDA